MFARCLDGALDPSPGGSSTSVQRAPALRTTPPVDHPAPLLGGSGEGAAAGSLAPINAAAPVEEQSAGHCAGS